MTEDSNNNTTMTPDPAFLLAISLSSDSESDSDSVTGETANNTNANVDRTALSEQAFQALKATYKPKVENGEIWSTITLPLACPSSKPIAQEVLHAAEELYFFRRYAKVVEFVQRVFSQEGGGGNIHLDEEVQRLLRYYESKARSRITSSSSCPSMAKDIADGSPTS